VAVVVARLAGGDIVRPFSIRLRRGPARELDGREKLRARRTHGPAAQAWLYMGDSLCASGIGLLYKGKEFRQEY